MHKFGIGFITSTTWDAGKGQFGILPEIFGTIVSSIIGVALAAVFGVAVAIFLTQEFIPHWLETILKNVIKLLAAIPSVVYGLWGIFVVIPAIRPACNWLHEHLGWIPALQHAAAQRRACCPRRWCWRSWCCRRSPRSRATPSPRSTRCCARRPSAWARRAGRRSSASSCRPSQRGIYGSIVLGLRPRARRDDGAGDAGRQRQRHQPVAVLAGRHAGGAAGQQVPRGGLADRPRRADVRGPRAAGPHAGW